MRTTFKKSISLLAIVSVLAFGAGCDSNDSEDVSMSFDQMGSMIEKSFSVFGGVAVDILLNSIGKSQPIYDCDQSGTVDYSMTDNPNEYALVLADCNGIDGNVNLGLTTDITETGFTFGLSLDGTLTESCAMTLNNFSMNVVSTDTDDQITLNGSLGSTCNGEAFACTFNNDTLTEGTEDSLVRDRCVATAN